MAAAPFVPSDFAIEHGYLADHEPRDVDIPEMADVVAEGSPKAHSVGVVRGAALPGVKPTTTTVAAARSPKAEDRKTRQMSGTFLKVFLLILAFLRGKKWPKSVSLGTGRFC